MSDSRPALTLFAHPRASYCWKVRLALYETETPFEHALVEGPPKTHATLPGLWPIAKMRPALAAYFERLINREASRRVISEARPYFQYFPFHEALDPRFLVGAD